jgi:hypothetical protein
VARWIAGAPERGGAACRSLKRASQSRYANARSSVTTFTRHHQRSLGMPLNSWREFRYRIAIVCNGRADTKPWTAFGTGSTHLPINIGFGVEEFAELCHELQPSVVRLGTVLCPFSSVGGAPSVIVLGRHAALVRELAILARGDNGLSGPWRILRGALWSCRRAEGSGLRWERRPGSTGRAPYVPEVPRAPSAALCFNIGGQRTRRPGRSRAWRIRGREWTVLAASNGG